METYEGQINKLSKYYLSKEYFDQAERIIKLLQSQDKKFPHVAALFIDLYEGEQIIIEISSHNYWNKNDSMDVTRYIFKCSKVDKEYLKEFFQGNKQKPKFSSHDGNYELYYPIETEHNKMFLYMAKRSRYGKYGS